jgi:DNA-binding MarR family transcriptional regulator
MVELYNKAYFKILKSIRGINEKRLKDISRDTGIDMARISPLVRLWEKSGILNRIENAGVLGISLTQKGNNVVESLERLELVILDKEKQEPKKMHEVIAEKPREKVYTGEQVKKEKTKVEELK